MTRLGISLGDPAGVGPEVLLRALARPGGAATATVFGDRGLMENLAGRLGLEMNFELRQVGPPLEKDFARGRWSETAARASMAYLKAAATAWEAGEIDALVTGPLHKRSLSFCGEPGPGQTEWLARRFGAKLPVMAFWSPSFWLVLATTHLPLRQVAEALEKERLLATVRVAQGVLEKYLAPRRPRLALCALNPHGEEEGQPGREEVELLEPVVRQAAQEGLNLQGPLAADSVFFLARRGDFDAVVALYHDQGLGPLKALHFNEAVHVTLGLPVPRTSPDHGVAYDLAGTGSADPTSMSGALRLAARLAQACP